MILATAIPLGVLALAVLLPLAREYTLLREAGLGARGALVAASSLLPSLGVGIAAALPLRESPALQWAATVAVTLAVYSAGVAALRSALTPEASRRSS